MVHADKNEDLQAAWPDWNVWRADGGSWLAARRGRVLTDQEMYGGLFHTLMEPTAEDLAVQLAEQQRLAGGAA